MPVHSNNVRPYLTYYCINEKSTQKDLVTFVPKLTASSSLPLSKDVLDDSKSVRPSVSFHQQVKVQESQNQPPT